MPRLHSIPLRPATPPSYFRTSGADSIPRDRKNSQSRGDTDVSPTVSTLHTRVRVKMFRGRFAPLSRFGPQSRGLTGTGISAGISSTLGGRVAGPKCHSMFKTPERKEFPSRHSQTLADNRPFSLTQKGSIGQPKTNISREN